MNIDALLAYAAIDEEKGRLLKEFGELDTVKNYRRYYKLHKDSLNLIAKLNEDSAAVVAQMKSLTDKYADAMKQLDEAKANIAAIEDEKETDFYSKNVEKLSAMLAALATDITAVSKRIADIRTQYDKAMAVGTDAYRRAKTLDAEYKKVYADYEPRLKEIEARLKGASAGIEAEVDRYNSLKKSKINNPVVPIYENTCKGCFVEVAANNLSKLAQDGYVICQNCGRIIYKK